MNRRSDATDIANTPRSGGVLSALCIAGAAGIFGIFSLPLWRGEIFLEHDIGAIFVPLRYFYARCLQTGESFLWIPNIFMGYYLQGEGQAGMTHPWHWLLYRHLPFTQAFDVELLSSYPFMFLGMALLLRRWNLSTPAVWFGSLLFTFSGYSMNSWLWLVHIGTLAHAPWMLLMIDVMMRSSRPRSVVLGSLGLVLFTTSAVLVGYPQLVYVLAPAEGLYAVFLLGHSPDRRRIAWVFLAKAAGIICAAIQLLPMLDVLETSTRADADYEFRMDQSLHPFNLFSLVNPYLFHQRMFLGNGYQGLYGGVVTTIFVVWLVVRIRQVSVDRRLVVCLFAMAGLGAVLALGKYCALYPWWSELPLIRTFRGPARHGAMFHIGWASLGVLAYAEMLRLQRDGRPIPWKQWAPILIVPLLSVTLALVIAVVHGLPGKSEYLAFLDAEFAPTRNAFVGAALAVIATGCFVAAARGLRYGMVALTLFVIIDLGLHGLRHRTTGDFESFRASIDVPDAPPNERIEPDWLPMYNVNGPLMKDYRMVTGLVSIVPKRELDYLVKPVPLRLAGVGWMRSRIGTNLELNRFAEQGIEWIRLDDAMPRARLVTKTIVSDDPNRDIYTIDFAATALVNVPLDLPDSEPGTVEVLEDRPGVIRVRVHAPNRQLLVLTEAFDDDWRSPIGNSRESQPVAVYGDFLGCVVPAGESEIRFEFAPRSYRLGKAVSVFGVLVVVVVHGLAYLAVPKSSGGRRAD